MPLFTPTSLLAWLESHQFLTPAQAAEFQSRLADFPDTETLVRDLLQHERLTAYQANQLLSGKADSLILGTYRLLERLGNGPQGEVFKARHAFMNRMVVLKVLAGPQVAEGFTREAHIASKLHHPNIVRLFDSGHVDNRHYLAFEYNDGTDLGKLAQQSGPLPIEQACDFVQQAALGLQHAFERGVVHGGIQLSTLLVTRPAPEAPQVIKIVDFGVARSGNGSQFAAPELMGGSTVADIRADVYGLGSTLLYLVSGQPAENAVYVRAFPAEVSVELESVLMRMLADDPDQRYQTPLQVAAALQPFSGVARPIPAQPQPHAGIPNLELETLPLSADGSVPIATPVYATAQSEETAAYTPSTFGEVAAMRPGEVPPSPLTLTAGEPAAPLVRTKPFARGKMGIVLAWLVGALVPLAIFAVFYFWRGSGNSNSKKLSAGSAGEVRILPLEDVVLQEGRNKFVIVRIERKGFRGPVKLRVEDLPESVFSPGATIPAGHDAAELKLTASFGAGDIQQRIRVLAIGENVRDEQSFQITVEPARGSSLWPRRERSDDPLPRMSRSLGGQMAFLGIFKTGLR
jgi:serine/threonine protein kinase